MMSYLAMLQVGGIRFGPYERLSLSEIWMIQVAFGKDALVIQVAHKVTSDTI
jgi:hypothetical protein